MFTLEEIVKASKGALAKPGKKTAGPRMPVSGVSTDSRSLAPGEAFIAIRGDNFDGHDFIRQAVRAGASCVIVEKGRLAQPVRDLPVVEVRDCVTALGDIAGFHRRRFSLPVICVTGSNGKTTAKDMCAAALSAGGVKVIKTEGTKNNQIGVPLTLLGLRPSHGAAVIELGSNHFGEIGRLTEICAPGIGVITSIGPSHLKYFKTTRGVLREKLSLLRGLSGPYAALVNADDPLLAKSAFAKSRKPFIMSIGVKRACDFRARQVRSLGAGGVGFRVGGRSFSLATPGCHNVYNALFACGVSRLLGLSYRDIAAGLQRFVFPPGRLNIVRIGRSTFIDDTYNASPASVREALRSLKGFTATGEKIVVLGDMLELGAREKRLHYEAGVEAAGSCGTFIAVGPLAAGALRALRDRGFSGDRLFSCGTPEEARDILVRRNLLKKGTVVLVKGSRRMKMERVFRDT